MSTIRYGKGNSPREQAAKKQEAKKQNNNSSPAPAPQANFSSVSGAQQQVTPDGTVLSSTQSSRSSNNQNASMPAPNFSSADGTQQYVPPPSAPLPAAPNKYGGMNVTPAPLSAQFYSSPAGEFVSGVKSSFGVENNGRDPETMTNAHQAGMLAGIIGQLYGPNTAERAAALSVSRVAELSQVGKLGRAGKIATTADAIATNTVTNAATASWLSKVAAQTRNPQVVASTLVAAIGSYPFAGFIKEEALQTLGFATSTAVRNGDLVGAQAAIDQQREVLHPAVVSAIMQMVPFVNVINNLQDFFKAAELKTNIDQRIVDDLVQKEANGETDVDYWARIYESRDTEREAQRISDEEYYAQVAIRQAEAKAAGRKADEEYWQKINDDREAATKRKRDEEEEYWAAYFKGIDDLRKKQGLANSKLNFGLL